MPQQHFAYLLSQAKHIEREVYMTKYPAIQYHNLVPVDTSASSWARGITHFSEDMTGRAAALAGRANDFPLVDIERSKFDVPIEMAGLGYDYSLEELNQAMMLRRNLRADKAVAVRRGVEEYIDDTVNTGRSDLGWDSLRRPRGVTRMAADNAGTGNGEAKRRWINKTVTQIVTDINAGLMGVWYGAPNAAANAADRGTRTTEMADTILLPPNILTELMNKTIDGTAVTAMQFIKENNVYTMTTGNALTIRYYRGLENAGWEGAANTDAGAPPNNETVAGRMICYRRAMDVLRLHMPMPFRFLSPWQAGPMRWIVPAIFRLGGLEIRLPGAIRVIDGI